MPATEYALRLEQFYGRAVRDLWKQVAAAVLRGYDGLDRDDLAAAFRAFVPLATQAVALGQQQAQALAVAFVQQYVETEASRAYRPAPRGDGIAERAPNGAPLSQAIASAAGVTWHALRQGRPLGEAMGLGRLYVGRLVGRAITDAADRELAHQAERSRNLLRGWTWVTVGDNCPACLAQQDGRVRLWSQGMRRHNGCDCARSPVIVGVPDRVQRPTGEDLFRRMSPDEQAAIFKNAGAEKAELVRSGAASLSDFVAIDPTPGGRVISEAPLEAVAP